MEINLTQIILAVLTLIFSLLTRYVIPNIKAKTNADQMELIRVAVKTVVYGIEQLYKSKPGQEKKKMVIEELHKQGYIVDVENVEDTMNILIEAAVKELNIDQQAHLD
jgi:competence protein ComGC